MVRFEDDDQGYRAWLAGHPDGLVLNAERRPRPSNLMLHRATCRTITGMPARGQTWTGDYIKVCGTRAELEEFAAREVGGSLRPCMLCAPG